MKKLFLLFLSFLLLHINIKSAPFYYFKGEKIELTVNRKAINIGFYNTVTVERRKEILVKYEELSHKGFVSNDESKKMLLSYSLISLAYEMDELGINKLMEKLLKEKEIRFCYPSFFSKNVDVPFSFVNQVIVRLKNRNDYNLLLESSRKAGYDLIEKYPFDQNVFVLNQSKQGINPLEYSQLLTESNNFEYAEPNFWFFVQTLSYPNPANNTHYADAWHINNTNSFGNSNNVGILDAWNYTTGCTNIKIAVSDDGVQLNHPDLAANLITGFDAITTLNPSLYYYNGSYNMNLGGSLGSIESNDESHGTAVAGVIGAINNSIGTIGVANTCKIQPIKTLFSWTYFFTNDVAYGPTATSLMIGASFDWCRVTGQSDVLNCSWSGFPGLPAASIVENPINNLISNGRNGLGASVFFAAGNSVMNNSQVYPNNKENVICVGAISHCDNKRQQSTTCDLRVATDGKYNSNIGFMLDIVAPGTNIPTTDLTSIWGGGYSEYSGDGEVYFNTFYKYAGVNDYVRFDGTSSAAPICAGIMGLIYSTNKLLTQTEAREIIESSASKYTNYNYEVNNQHANGLWNEEMGYGIVNAGLATEYAYDTYYYQNQTLSNVTDNHIRIFAGKNVTTRIPEGNVTVSNTGNTTLTARRIIHLKAGFKATAGSGSRFLAKIDKLILPPVAVACTSSTSRIIGNGISSNDNVDNRIINKQNLLEDEVNNVFSALQVYPSPAYAELNIHIENINQLPAQLVITDLVGREVLKQNINTRNFSEKLNISQLNNGVYFLNISNANGTQSVKFLVSGK